MNFSVRTFALVSSVLLAACGGGGGDGGTAAPAPVSAQAVVITETNAKPVAANALAAAQGTSTTSGTALVTGVDVQTEGAATSFSVKAMAEAARVTSASLAGRANLVTGAAVSESFACELGGSLTVSGNLSSDQGLVAGDNLTLTASNCKMMVDGMTSTMNGSMSMTIVSGSMTSIPFHVVISFVATDLSVSVGSETIVVSGDVRLDWTVSSATSETMVASGTSMGSRLTNGTTTNTSSLKNYSQTISVNGSIMTSSLSGTVETNSSRLGSSAVTYTVTTPTPLVWNSSTNSLTAGVVKVVGANNSQLLMTVVSTNTVSIQIDANGDGTFEKTVSSTVTELDTLL